MFVSSSLLSRAAAKMAWSTASRSSLLLTLGPTESRLFSDKKAAPKKASTTTAKPAAASAGNSQQHRPPIQLSGLAAKYANATYVVASQQSALTQVESELLAIAKAAAGSPKLAQFLGNPLIARDVKFSAVASLDRLHPVTRNLLQVLAGNARLAELPKIAATLQQLMQAHRGQVDVKIISAEPLSAAQLALVQAALSHQVPPGKTVLLQQMTDPSIVGGLQVQMGDAFLDLSVQSRIASIARLPVG
jgi:F-type H+-transporting ATPase subunit O